MALPTGVAMAIVMIGFAWSRYPKRGANVTIFGALSLRLGRSRETLGEATSMAAAFIRPGAPF